MAFTLPDLPYPHDALKPYMSAETLEFHHDKHHLAYVNNGNNALKGTEWEGKPLEEIVKGSFGKNPAVFNNAGQHYNHTHFWKWMKPNASNKIPGELEKALEGFVRLDRKGERGLHRGRHDPVRLGLGVADAEGWQDHGDQDRERRKSARARRQADPRRRCVGALLLHRLSQPPARLSQGVGRAPHQLGICGRAVRPEVTPILGERDTSRSIPRKGAGAHRAFGRTPVLQTGYARFGHMAMIGSDHRVLGISLSAGALRSEPEGARVQSVRFSVFCVQTSTSEASIA